MAKQTNQPLGGRSKFRLLYIDGDLQNGDLQTLANTIAGALRPSPVIIKGQIADKLTETELKEEKDLGDQNGAEDTEVIETPSEQQQTPRTPVKRKYRSPKIVNDLDMEAGGKSFAEFTTEKGSPSEHQVKYLVAAYWLGEHAKIPTISEDHIYTCYKAAGWTFDVVDPVKPFRNLKTQGYGDVEDGKFTINHIGKGRIQKMKVGNGG